MILINQNRNLMIFLDNLFSINIHTGGKKIMANAKNPTTRDQILGVYDTEEKCARAFEGIIQAIEREEYSYSVLLNTDQQLNTQNNKMGGYRQVQTNGKTK